MNKKQQYELSQPARDEMARNRVFTQIAFGSLKRGDKKKAILYLTLAAEAAAKALKLVSQ